MAWGSSFDKVVKPMQEQIKSLGTPELDAVIATWNAWCEPQPTVWPAAIVTIDHGISDTTAYALFKDGKYEQISEADFRQAEFKSIEIREHTNKVPTHDHYTNPNAIIYYECKCGQILDPGTKRFAELNNCASNAGWKIRFGDSGYVPYCVECGKGVE